MKRRWWRWVRAAALVLPIVLLCASVFGRAGGGGGYGGGGGNGGGGGGGDGGDLFFLVFQLIRLAIYYPALGVPLLIIIVLVIIAAQRKGTNLYQTSVIRRGNVVLDTQTREEMLGPLKYLDPRFDIEQFRDRVVTAFEKIQWAWSNQDLQRVRAFISDGVYERFNLQFDEQRALGYRNEMREVRVDDVRIVHVQSDRVFTTLAVRIAATARDLKVSLNDGSTISEAGGDRSFVEIWSFLRRRDAKTDAGKGGLIEGQCPNCGAAIEMNQNANCAHCGALLRSGQYDWVLVEITQESEWAGTQRTDLPSVAALARRDPDFNLQEVEDRASVVFWRYAAAERLASADPLRKIATAEFCDAYAAELRARAGGRYEYDGERAVGSVDTLGIVSEEEWDRAMVEVRWEGTPFIGLGNAAQRIDRPKLVRTVLELSRGVGVKSDAERAIASAHCPNCGAPEAGGSSGLCAFCGTALNDGTRGWTLTAIRSPDDAREMLRGDRSAQAAVMPPEGNEPAITAPSAAGMLAWMIHAAVADGNTDERETQMITRFAQRYHVPPQRVGTMLAAARNNQIDLPMPLGPKESQQWLRAMTSTALADGNLTAAETALLSRTAQRVGLSNYDVQMLVKRQRQEMYAAAKAALRSAP